MQAQLNQWYVRWFLWNCKVMDMFLGRRNANRYSQGTNLCHFFRTLMLGSLVTVLSVAVWAYMLITMLVMPFVLFNFVSVAVTVGVVVTMFAVIVGVVAVIAVAPAVIAGAAARVNNKVKDTAQSPPGLARVAWAYVMGIKNRFCPTIKFGKDAQ